HQRLAGTAAVAEAAELQELVELHVVALEFEIDELHGARCLDPDGERNASRTPGGVTLGAHAPPGRGSDEMGTELQMLAWAIALGLFHLLLDAAMKTSERGL